MPSMVFARRGGDDEKCAVKHYIVNDGSRISPIYLAITLPTTINSTGHGRTPPSR